MFIFLFFSLPFFLFFLPPLFSLSFLLLLVLLCFLFFLSSFFFFFFSPFSYIIFFIFCSLFFFLSLFYFISLIYPVSNTFSSLSFSYFCPHFLSLLSSFYFFQSKCIMRTIINELYLSYNIVIKQKFWKLLQIQICILIYSRNICKVSIT